jgi:hypothetical protein
VDNSPRWLFVLAAAALFVGFAACWRCWLRTTLAGALAGFFLAGGAAITAQEAAVLNNSISLSFGLLDSRAAATRLNVFDDVMPGVLLATEPSYCNWSCHDTP